MANPNLTIFHITHWKAGSQWIAEILKNSAPERFISMEVTDPHGMKGRGILNFYVNPLKRGKIYGTVYLTREQFQSVVFGPFWRTQEPSAFNLRRAVSNWLNFGVFHSPYRAFVIIRDLRDTLVSLYFSTKYSHKIITDQLADLRYKLVNSSVEEGMLYLIDHVLPDNAAIQISWINAPNILSLRYEEILGNEYSFFEKLMDSCEIDISRERLRKIVYYNTFETATGRKPGQEDINAHLRKGIAGDWKNHFTDRVKEKFKRNYGEILVKTGYEKDLNW